MARKLLRGHNDKSYYDNTVYRSINATNDPLNEGYFALLCNFDISDSGASLTPREGYLTTTLCTTSSTGLDLLNIPNNLVVFYDTKINKHVVLFIDPIVYSFKAYITSLSCYNLLPSSFINATYVTNYDISFNLIAKHIVELIKFTYTDPNNPMHNNSAQLFINELTSGSTPDVKPLIKDLSFVEPFFLEPTRDSVGNLAYYTKLSYKLPQGNLASNTKDKDMLTFWVKTYYRKDASSALGQTLPADTLVIELVDTFEQTRVLKDFNIASPKSRIPDPIRYIEPEGTLLDDSQAMNVSSNMLLNVNGKYTLTSLPVSASIQHDIKINPIFYLNSTTKVINNQYGNWAFRFDIINSSWTTTDNMIPRVYRTPWSAWTKADPKHIIIDPITKLDLSQNYPVDTAHDSTLTYLVTFKDIAGNPKVNDGYSWFNLSEAAKKVFKAVTYNNGSVFNYEITIPPFDAFPSYNSIQNIINEQMKLIVKPPEITTNIDAYSIFVFSVAQQTRKYIKLLRSLFLQYNGSPTDYDRFTKKNKDFFEKLDCYILTDSQTIKPLKGSVDYSYRKKRFNDLKKLKYFPEDTTASTYDILGYSAKQDYAIRYAGPENNYTPPSPFPAGYSETLKSEKILFREICDKVRQNKIRIIFAPFYIEHEYTNRAATFVGDYPENNKAVIVKYKTFFTLQDIIQAGYFDNKTSLVSEDVPAGYETNITNIAYDSANGWTSFQFPPIHTLTNCNADLSYSITNSVDDLCYLATKYYSLWCDFDSLNLKRLKLYDNDLDYSIRVTDCFKKYVSIILYARPYSNNELYNIETRQQVFDLNYAWDNSSYLLHTGAINWKPDNDVLYLEESRTEDVTPLNNSQQYVFFEDRMVVWANSSVYISETGKYNYFLETMKYTFQNNVLKVLPYKTILLIFTTQHLYVIYKKEEQVIVGYKEVKDKEGKVVEGEQGEPIHGKQTTWKTQIVLYNLNPTENYLSLIQVFNQMILFCSDAGQLYLIKPNTNIDSETQFTISYINKQANDILRNYPEYLFVRLYQYGCVYLNNIDLDEFKKGIKINCLVDINRIQIFYSYKTLITFVLIYDVINNRYTTYDTVSFTNVLGVVHSTDSELYLTEEQDKCFFTFPKKHPNEEDSHYDSTYAHSFKKEPIHTLIDTGNINLNNHLVKRFKNLNVTIKNIDSSQIIYNASLSLDDQVYTPFHSPLFKVKMLNGPDETMKVDKLTLIEANELFGLDQTIGIAGDRIDVNSYKLHSDREFFENNMLLRTELFNANKLIEYSSLFSGSGKVARFKMSFISKGKYKVQSYGIIYREKHV